MARDYLAIPRSSSLAERSFSMSARTDDVRCQQMKAQKFGDIQWLRSAYHDGRLTAVTKAWMDIDAKFNFGSNVE